jgi:hypothetical protein
MSIYVIASGCARKPLRIKAQMLFRSVEIR